MTFKIKIKQKQFVNKPKTQKTEKNRKQTWSSNNVVGLSVSVSFSQFSSFSFSILLQLGRGGFQIASIHSLLLLLLSLVFIWDETFSSFETFEQEKFSAKIIPFFTFIVNDKVSSCWWRERKKVFKNNLCSF